MRISKLIPKLKAVIKEHGDIPVMTSYDGGILGGIDLLTVIKDTPASPYSNNPEIVKKACVLHDTDDHFEGEKY